MTMPGIFPEAPLEPPNEPEPCRCTLGTVRRKLYIFLENLALDMGLEGITTLSQDMKMDEDYLLSKFRFDGRCRKCGEE